MAGSKESGQERGEVMVLTYWGDIHGQAKRARKISWPEFCEWLKEIPAQKSKESSPLIKLATFGEAKTPKGSLRHDDNVLKVYGVEGDYDSGVVTPEEAVQALEKHQVRGVVVTTFRHTPDKPRWRVFAPLSKPVEPSERLHLAERLNGVLGGILARETGALSQSYFIGGAEGGEYKVLATFDDAEDGAFLDEEIGLDIFKKPFVTPTRTPTAAHISGEIIEGQRNATLTSLAGTMKRRNMSEAAILAALREENKRCVPPLYDPEVASIARSVSGYPPAELPDESSVMSAAMSLTPDSSSEDIAAIVQAATKTLGAVARQKVYAAIKKATGLPLSVIRQEAASAFEEDEPDHLVLARKVIENYGQENILCTDGDVWTWSVTGVWQEAPDREVKGRVHEVVEELTDVTQNRVNGVFDILKTEIYKTRHIWNANSDLINFSNGTLRLSHNGVILDPHKREHFHNIQIPIAYDPDAPEPKHLHAFLNSVWSDDSASISTLQELVGYLLTSDTRQQKIPMIVGPRRSGKGTIYRLLVKLLGNHNIAGPTLSSLQQPFGLQPLIGKALAVISDARLGSRAEQHAITERLLAVSGEDTLSIPRKYMDDWTGKLNTRFLILTNELPRLADASGALASRFIALKMDTSFLGREDHDLDNKLASELPSILNWAIEGLYRLKERGYFIQPQSAREAIEELNDLGSPISAFIRDICIIQPGAEVECKGLYEAWRQWCETQGREHPGTLQTFGRDLKAVLPSVKTIQRRADGQVLRLYSGAGIRDVTQCHALYAIVSPTQEDIKKEDIGQLPICKTNGADNIDYRVTARDSDLNEIMEVLE